ncbi:MAG TPA: lysylphosphatidylglycerol synthase transmembrane domain-containing protein [Polyangiales bacterium]|nr:lysylphosphatidylglycerol synthase transmembrane domain-containing protein [Polyangiales bacterium]
MCAHLVDLERPPRRPFAPERVFDWQAWLPGLIVLAVVVLASLHFSETREFVRVAERARPLWLLAALSLQTLTYAAQGEVFRGPAKLRKVELRMATVYRLSLMKLFLDQAFPSLGLSGTVAVARELKHAGVPRALVATCVVISIVSFQLAYATAVVTAVPIIVAHRGANAVLIAAAVVFALAVSAWSAVVLALSKRRSPLPRTLVRLRPLRELLEFVKEADAALTGDVWSLTRATCCQLAIVVLDAATVWVLLLSLGEVVPPDIAFASFMLASMSKTVGVVPGGLGTFEAMAVAALNVAGVSVPVALSATVMFRGLSFWLPMLIGLVLYRGGRVQPCATR